MNTRLAPDNRRAVIVTAAIRIAETQGIWAVTHGSVAKRCVVPTAMRTVRHYFANRDELWRAVLEETKSEKVRQQAEEMGWKS